MDLWILLIALHHVFCESLSTISELNNSDPKFSASINNVTVPVGRDAILTCMVNDLAAFKVAWLRVDTQTILSIQNHVITKNHRIAISHTEHRIWQLRVRDVCEPDRGWYMCQINTDPMKSQVGYLDVVVPPDIIDTQTSHDMVVQEGTNATLICSGTGLPAPAITWRRERDIPLVTANGREVLSIEGPNMTLWQVKRENMGAYFCIASNGIPPTVSKRVLLIVNFVPFLWTRYDTIYVGFGQKVILECVSESQPISVNFWLKGKNLMQGGTYDTVTEDNVYKITMRLSVRPMKQKDFGEYKCVAKNIMGETERTISIHHKTKKDIHHAHQTSERGNQFILIEEFESNSCSGGYIKFISISAFNIFLNNLFNKCIF